MDLSNSVTPSPPLTIAAVRGGGGRGGGGGGGEENKKMLIYGNVLRFLASYSEKQSTLLKNFLTKKLAVSRNVYWRWYCPHPPQQNYC